MTDTEILDFLSATHAAHPGPPRDVAIGSFYVTLGMKKDRGVSLRDLLVMAIQRQAVESVAAALTK
jgi:hypothetical protein